MAPCPLGHGLFADRPFAAGETILRLDGRRYFRDDPIHLSESGANLLQTGRSSYIMLEHPAVFANHSCAPNAGIRASRWLVAIAPIARGDEIRFDYSTTMAEDLWTLECRCGAPECRGLVTDFRWLPAALKERYLGLDIVPAFIRRQEYSRRRAPAGLAGEVGGEEC